MCGHSHNRAGTVAHQHIVGNEQRQLLAVNRVCGPQASKHASLLTVCISTVSFRSARSLGAVGGYSLNRGGVATLPLLTSALRPSRGDLKCGGVVGSSRVSATQKRVLRGYNREGSAKESVRAGGEHGDLTAIHPLAANRKINLGALRATNPVALHRTHLVRPVHSVQVISQTLTISGDAHHPLAQVALENREVTALRATIRGDLLIGQHRAQARTPVNRHLSHIGQAERVNHAALLQRAELIPAARVSNVLRQLNLAVSQLLTQLTDRAGRTQAATVTARRLRVKPGVEYLQENPLGPAHIVNVNGGNRAARVVAHTHAVQLATHVGNVGLSGNTRVLAGLHSVLLGGQTKSVITHGVKHVLALHTVEAGNHVSGQVTQGVTHVQALTRGVGEHIQ